MLRSAAAGPFAGVITVASWLKLLSPLAVAEYLFSGYDSLLSHLAMEHLLDEDFPRANGENDTPTVQNLRAALLETYLGSTCEIIRQENRLAVPTARVQLRVAITVPGGTSDTWPSQIPEPENVVYPTRRRV